MTDRPFWKRPKGDRLRFERTGDGDALHQQGCKKCGEKGHRHAKERRILDGRFWYEYRCPQ